MKNDIFGARMKLGSGCLRRQGFRRVGKHVWNKLNVDLCVDIHWFSSFPSFLSFSSCFISLYCKKEENEVFFEAKRLFARYDGGAMHRAMYSIPSRRKIPRFRIFISGDCVCVVALGVSRNLKKEEKIWKKDEKMSKRKKRKKEEII